MLKFRAGRHLSLSVLPIVIAAFLFTAQTAHAAGAYIPPETDFELDDEDSRGPAIALDLVLVRPLGVVATLLGTTVFLIGLPIEAVTREVSTARHFLVEQPARFTFVRPLGEWDEEDY